MYLTVFCFTLLSSLLILAFSLVIQPTWLSVIHPVISYIILEISGSSIAVAIIFLFVIFVSLLIIFFPLKTSYLFPYQLVFLPQFTFSNFRIIGRFVQLLLISTEVDLLIIASFYLIIAFPTLS